jgi:hypothetical protein
MIGYTNHFAINPKLSIAGSGSPFTITFPEMEAGSVYNLKFYTFDDYQHEQSATGSAYGSTIYPVGGVINTPPSTGVWVYELTVTKDGYQSVVTTNFATKL